LYPRQSDPRQFTGRGLLAEVYWQRLCKDLKAKAVSSRRPAKPTNNHGPSTSAGSLGRSRGSMRRRGIPCHFGRQIPTSSACGQTQSLHRLQEGQGLPR